MNSFILILCALIFLPIFLTIYFVFIAPYRVEYVHHPLPIKNLPEHLIGARLVHISDMHTGYRVPNRYLIRVFNAIRALNPEFVVFTGDYITHERVTEIHNLAPVLAQVPHGSIGTIGVLGNHDYGAFTRYVEVAEIVMGKLEAVGVRVLRNESVNCSGLNIIGLDDYRSPNFNPGPVLSEINLEEANLVLAHNPDTADIPVWNGYTGWILSGHTHGGQVSIPFVGPPLLPVKNRRYAAGEVEVGDGRRVYINRGIGHLTKLRVNVRPEITIHELQKRPA